MPLMRVLLGAGDWLYIPCGYWHKAEARGDETSISLAVGLMSPAAIDVYDFLRQRLAHSLMWRQRLPIRGHAASRSSDELAAQYQQLFQQLADDLQKVLRDSQFVDDFLARNQDSDPARP
jgi:ribosomal protein L16 Arg81 hydroxylase